MFCKEFGPFSQALDLYSWKLRLPLRMHQIRLKARRCNGIRAIEEEMQHSRVVVKLKVCCQKQHYKSLQQISAG